MPAPGSELVERDRLGGRLGRVEARRGGIRGPEAGVLAQPALGVAAAEVEQARDEDLVEEDEREQLTAGGRLRAAEQAREQREIRGPQGAQAAVALPEGRLGERADRASPGRGDE